jgi:AcrR family transcriptional regulator
LRPIVLTSRWATTYNRACFLQTVSNLMSIEPPERIHSPLPRGRHGLPRHSIVRSQRLRLMRAVIDIVGVEGYNTTTVRMIVEHAGVSRRTFYELFQDREDCFVAA